MFTGGQMASQTVRAEDDVYAYNEEDTDDESAAGNGTLDLPSCCVCA